MRERLSPRRGTHHHYPDFADQSSEEVPPIRPEATYQEAPGQRQGDEDAAVGGVGPPELGDGLQGGHHPIRCEDQTSNERLCCPFFDFALTVERGGGPVWLRMTGKGEAKHVLEAEMGVVRA